MKIGSVNVDSLLLVFHNSKVAYCSNSVLRLFYVSVLCFVGTCDRVPTFRQRRREIEERNEITLFSLVEALRVPRALHMKNAWISPALEINLIGQMRKKQSEAIWILDVYFQMLTNVPDLKFMSVNNSATTQLEGDSNPLITRNRRFTWKWGYSSNLAFVQARLPRL